MRIQRVVPQEGFILHVVAENGEVGYFDVSPYLDSEVFEALRNPEEFQKLYNGGYFVEWECGADLSSDTIEARWIRHKEIAEKSA
jgi:hypothetical protein